MPPRSYTVNRKSFSSTIASAGTAILTDLGELNGKCVGILITSPDLDDSDTFTVSLETSDGYVLYSLGTLAEDLAHELLIDANNFPLHLPLEGSHNLRITASGAQAADRTFTGRLLIDMNT